MEIEKILAKAAKAAKSGDAVKMAKALAELHPLAETVRLHSEALRKGIAEAGGLPAPVIVEDLKVQEIVSERRVFEPLAVFEALKTAKRTDAFAQVFSASATAIDKLGLKVDAKRVPQSAIRVDRISRADKLAAMTD